MKKRLFLGLLAVAAVSFTACQKDEVISQMPKDQAIEFGTYLGRGAQTKGSVITTTELQTQGFGVYAYYTGQSAMSAYSIPAVPNFLNNEKVSGADWSYTNTKYWPNTPGDKISFYAYGPYDGANDNAIALATGAEKKPVLTYTVNADIAKHMDVLFAPAQENFTKPAPGTKVDMKFYHALSRIGFKVNTAADYSAEGVTITLKNVTLNGKFYTSADMDLGTAGINTTGTPAVFSSVKDNWAAQVTPGSAVSFEYFNGTQDVAYKANTDATSTDDDPVDVNGSKGYIMVIPQNFESTDKIELSVSYDLTVTSSSSTTSNTVSKSINFNFEAGKAYTFLITIGGLQKVEFTADVINWQDGGTDDSFTWN